MKTTHLLLIGGSFLVAAVASAQESNLAKELANPVAALISVPIQAN
jgi:hypothetical protein